MILSRSLVAGASAVCFAAEAGSLRVRRAAIVLTTLIGLFGAAHTVLVWWQFPVLRILWAKGSFEARPLYEKWNSYSRVRVSGNPDVPERPYARSLSSIYPKDRLVRELRMDIDVAASTTMIHFTGDVRDVDFLRYDVTDIGHYLRPAPNVLVVGTGGGRDLLAALAFDAQKVTGVEINREIVGTLNGRFGDFSGHLDRDPRVRFVNDEARSYVARSGERYDFIQISLIDTWAATAAGAFVLSENAVYTVEAWRVFLQHLTDGGVLSVSRWHIGNQPGEVYRMICLATESLRAVGVNDPRGHLALIRTPTTGAAAEVGVATLLVSLTAIAAEDLTRLQQHVERLKFETVLSPTIVKDPTIERLVSGGDQRAFVDAFPVNISAPTDNSPFFFQMLRFRDMFKWHLMDAGKSGPNMVAVFVLGVLLATVALLTLLCIVVPLSYATGHGLLRGAGSLLTFFGAIGLAFMLIETSQMQRLIIVLGHPTYGLSVVLFALLLAGGLGSHLTRNVTADSIARAGRTRLFALLGLLLVFGLATPWLTHRFEGATTPMRIAIAVTLLFPPGVLMGMAFPLGMKIAAAREPRLTPWLWGINGALSVFASVLAVVIALAFTISSAFWAGWVAYAVAAVAYQKAARSRT